MTRYHVQGRRGEYRIIRTDGTKETTLPTIYVSEFVAGRRAEVLNRQAARRAVLRGGTENG